MHYSNSRRRIFGGIVSLQCCMLCEVGLMALETCERRVNCTPGIAAFRRRFHAELKAAENDRGTWT
jgi:hypothetical protein